MKHLYLHIAVVLLVSSGCSTHVLSKTVTSSNHLNEYTLAGVKYLLHLPSDMRPSASIESAETANCAYSFFERKPFTAGTMMEERYVNQMVVTHFSHKQYEALKQNNGATFFPELYADTIDKLHPEVTSYELPEGRGVVLRYDIRYSKGIFCVTAVILDQKMNPRVFNEDVELMTKVLKSFKLVQNS